MASTLIQRTGSLPLGTSPEQTWSKILCLEVTLTICLTAQEKKWLLAHLASQLPCMPTTHYNCEWFSCFPLPATAPVFWTGPVPNKTGQHEFPCKLHPRLLVVSVLLHYMMTAQWSIKRRLLDLLPTIFTLTWRLWQSEHFYLKSEFIQLR